MTIIQNARTSGGGVVSNVPSQALSVGPLETWKCGKVSIWHAGNHDNPFGLRLTTLMISKKIPDAAVPMSFSPITPTCNSTSCDRESEPAKPRCTEEAEWKW